MDAIREKLHELEKQYNEINAKLSDEEVVKNPKELTRLSKEEARLSQPVEALHKLEALDKRIEEAEELAKDDDAEMKEMAAMELEECVPAREELLGHIQHLLIPRDPDDDHDVIMEIRGGAGGDEGNIFAGDLFRMYSKYAENMGWKVQVLEASVSEAGGFSQIVFSVKGTDVYKHLKFESGAHRVQRVPKTEAQGRIHTSTATVLAQPEAEEADIDIDPKDLTIETHRASGAGGQHINKTDSAVRIVHIPTGITVNCQEGRSQIENRETAMRLIRARVYEELKRRKEEEEGKIRREKIGTGDRSEKIRTYNYPQNRVTDHRIGLTITQLDRIMEGKLDDVIGGLLAEEEKKKVRGCRVVTTFSKKVRLYEKKCSENSIPEETVMAYLVELSNRERYNLYMNFDEEMPTSLEEEFDAGMARILNDEPLGHVLGYSWFYGYKMIVNGDVLIPRYETEELCGHILSRIDEYFGDKKELDVADVGTGSGAIAIALCKEEPKIKMSATDISEEALETAKQNALNNEANITFYAGDMLKPLIDKGIKLDILVSNPPYIPSHEEMEHAVVDYEPHVALFGGEDGLKFYREIFRDCKQVLKDKAFMAFEMGYDQRERMTNLVQEMLPEARFEILKDMNGKDRMLFVYFSL